MLHFSVYHKITSLRDAGRSNRLLFRSFQVKLTGIFTACLLVTGSVLPVHAAQTPEERLELQRAMTVQSNAVENWPNGPVVNAEAAILMEAETGTILYAKNIHQQEYPASTTKILTCLIAAEQCSLDEIVTFSHSAIFDTPSGYAHLAFDVGEELTMEQALNAILIASDNAVAFAAAEHIAGTTWQDFGDIMNRRAAELGCLNSNFVNPNGLSDNNHYTTAYDLAMIGRAFFANELLCKLSSTYKLHIPPSDNQPDDITAYSKNKLLPGQTYEYEYLVGSKTGYTDAARNCLVTCAEKDGMKLICVVFKDESPLQFEDTVSLLDYGFSNFEKVIVSQAETKYNIDNAGFFYSEHDIFGSSKPILSLNKDDYIVLPKNIQFEDTTSAISYDAVEDSQIAFITYSYNGVALGTASVDLAGKEEATYTFDTPLQPAKEKSEDETPAGPDLIFVNVVKIFLSLAAIAAVLFVILLVRAILRNYAFTRQQNNRRSWRRDRRKRVIHLPVYSSLQTKRKAQMRDSKKRKKKGKRPNKFRDYDF